MKLKEYQNSISIRPSRIKGAGLGVFAREFIPKGTLLGWYRGNIISRQEWIDSKDDSYMWMLTKGKHEWYIDAKDVKQGNKLRYVNGCMTPGQTFSVNVEAYQKGNHIWYETCRKINQGEELIVDYGGDYWTPVEV